MSTHQRKFLVALVALFVAASALAVGTQEQKELTNTQQVLERFIDALGGREAIEKLTTRVCLGRVTSDLPSYQPPVYESVNFQSQAKIPHKTYYRTLVDGYGEKAGSNGKVGWTENKCGVLSDDRVNTEKFHWLINPQNALLIEDYYPDLVFAGKKEVRGHTVYALEPAGLDPAFWAFYFDANTGLLSGIGHYWDLEDYREIDGVLFPHRVLTSRKGGQTWWEFYEVKHNVPVDDSLFTMPTHHDK